MKGGENMNIDDIETVFELPQIRVDIDRGEKKIRLLQDINLEEDAQLILVDPSQVSAVSENLRKAAEMLAPG